MKYVIVTVLAAAIAAAAWFFLLQGGSVGLSQKGSATSVAKPDVKPEMSTPAPLVPKLKVSKMPEESEGPDFGEGVKIELPNFGETKPANKPAASQKKSEGQGWSIPVFSGIWDVVSSPLSLIRWLMDNFILFIIILLFVWVVLGKIVGTIISKVLWAAPLLIWEIVQTGLISKKDKEEKNGRS